MFTGIVETIGTVIQKKIEGSNHHFLIESKFSSDLQVDQSVAHDGVCLTITKVEGNKHWVTAVDETIQKTNLGQWQEGRKINLERAMKLGDRLDGHIVQGHVDTTALCTEKIKKEGSYLFQFQYPETFAGLIIEKGSICINGVSLTVFNVTENSFTVTIIPYTFEHTTFQYLQSAEKVNVEFDILGKYILRHQQIQKS